MSRENIILKKQLHREKQKNKELRKKLALLEGKLSIEKDDAPKELHRRATDAVLFSNKGYFSYLASLLQSNSFYQAWKKFTLYFRRIGLVSTTFRIVGYIFALVQTGTLFFLALIVILLALPTVALIAFAMLLLGKLYSRRDNKKLIAALTDKKVYIFFPARTAEFSHGTFWKENMLSLAVREDTVVLVVSPYFLSRKSVTANKRAYLNYKQETPSLYTVRKHYYFSLCKKLQATCKSIALIY